jgi:acetyl-CoA acetyltransferase
VAKPQAAIIGVGESRIGRVPGVGAIALMLEATDKALASAGLDMAAIDGVITVPVKTETASVSASMIARAFAIEPRFINTIDLTGASGAAMIDQAAQAITAGHCETVLCVAGQPLLSGMSRDGAVASMANSAAHPEAEVPYGPPVPALYALFAARHMHEFGTTREQLAAVAVQMRKHAGLNDNAHFQKPITVADVLAAKPIATPFTMLDCAPVSDGAAAMIVVSAARARQIKPKAAYLHGAGYGIGHGYLSDGLDLMHTGARRSGKAAFAASGMRPADMDFASLYDCFTITLLLELEELGLCPRGEAGRFVADGHIDREGSLPTNTNGGLLSGGHPGLPAGLLPVVEAARQMMGEAGARQLPRTDRAVVHGNGGVVALHCTLVLGSENV